MKLTADDTASFVHKMLKAGVPSLGPQYLTSLVELKRGLESPEFRRGLTPEEERIAQSYIDAVNIVIALGDLHIKGVLATLELFIIGEIKP